MRDARGDRARSLALVLWTGPLQPLAQELVFSLGDRAVQVSSRGSGAADLESLFSLTTGPSQNIPRETRDLV